ncbi:helix-turn-helix domain-containing protein [Streptomyces fuscigenes]|uniref:helix-turn-helix domain-containing protein n=1 Tax=Streptomyces fuscigenes TaxID=1528880 RepID=UPI001F1C5E8F|nr:helix-turn-helix domain-containing protein [Streptomyces fuscigenes]MCF3960427.1 helix-turn-helix domain-containing protein [Streptomyces fuscigenes]
MTKTDIRPVKLPPNQAEAANHALTRVRSYLDTHQDRAEVTVTVEDGEPEPLTLPREVVELLARMLGHLGAGRGVSIVPADAELTTQQAADMLNVSRPFLIGLLDAGEIEYRTVGTHRRIKASSLFEYKQQDDTRRQAAADELLQLDQEMGLM